jgi:XTP/dITP diphosphohydrolase
MKSLVLASTNPGKIADFKALLAPYSIQLIPQAELSVPEVPETGLTFVENALIKARNAAELTGLPAFSDDSGLVVDGLEGAPGLYSARFAGPKASAEDNINKLLAELAKKPQASRKARLYCVITLLRYPYDPAPLICEGTWEGEILEKPRGHNGFGYLPIFYSTQHRCGAAELNDQERARTSHRGQAFQSLLHQYLKEIQSLNSVKSDSNALSNQLDFLSTDG